MNVSRLLSACLLTALFIPAASELAKAKSIFERPAPESRATSETTLSSSRTDLVDLVDREARAHGLPVALARAVVRIESNWKPQITGRAGEVGTCVAFN